MDLEKALQRLGGDEELLHDLIGFYLEDYPGLVDEIDCALDEQEGEALATAAHSLKGLIANFNDEVSQQIAQQIEIAARDGQIEVARTLATRMRKQATSLAQTLVEFRDSDSS